MVDRARQDFVKASKERQVDFKAGILAKLLKIIPTTPQSNMGSCNLKTNHLVIPEFVINPQQHSKNLKNGIYFLIN